VPGFRRSTHIPPLCERLEDLPALAEHFLERHGASEGKPGARFTPESARPLQAYRWPGNVHELENEVQRALALDEAGAALDPAHFSERGSHVLDPIEASVRPGERATHIPRSPRRSGMVHRISPRGDQSWGECLVDLAHGPARWNEPKQELIENLVRSRVS